MHWRRRTRCTDDQRKKEIEQIKRSWNQIPSLIQATKNMIPAEAPKSSQLPPPIRLALHADSKVGKQQITMNCRKTLIQSQKSGCLPLRCDWLVKARAEFQSLVVPTSLLPDQDNLSSVHVNTGTHRGTMWVYDK